MNPTKTADEVASPVTGDEGGRAAAGAASEAAEAAGKPTGASETGANTSAAHEEPGRAGAEPPAATTESAPAEAASVAGTPAAEAGPTAAGQLPAAGGDLSRAEAEPDTPATEADPTATGEPPAPGGEPMAEADPTATGGEPAAEGEPEPEPEPTPAKPRRPAWLRLPALLIAAAVVLTGAGTWFTLEARSAAANPAAANLALTDVGATADVTSAVTLAINRVFSYSYDRTDVTEKAADAVLRGAAKDSYDKLFAQVRQKAPEQKLVLTSRVSAIAVQELADNHARLLVFLDQSAVRADNNATDSAAAQLSVSAERTGGTWVITALEPR